MPSSIRKCVDEEKEGKGFYITPGLDKCLAIYPELHFKKETAKKLSELSFTNKKARTFLRLFFSRSSFVTCDEQGRIVIPQLLKDYAGLKKEVVIIGVMDRIEIWDLKHWNDFEEDNEQNFERDAEDLFQLGSAPNQ
jgi:MraZ protein